MEIEYKITFSKEALKDAEFWKVSGNNIAQRKITEILTALRSDPYSPSPGDPEKLRYTENYSRRINGKDRIIYRIDEAEKVIVIVRMRGHYDDK